MVRARRARLLIADDHHLIRASLQQMLAGEPDLTVVGEATTGQEALALCRQRQPDLVLMDLRMPELGGLAATAVITRTFPQIRVMVLSISEFSGSLVQARQAGAAGYLFKEATQAELVSAIRQVLQGRSVFPSQLP